MSGRTVKRHFLVCHSANSGTLKVQVCASHSVPDRLPSAVACHPFARSTAHGVQAMSYLSAVLAVIAYDMTVLAVSDVASVAESA